MNRVSYQHLSLKGQRGRGETWHHWWKDFKVLIIVTSASTPRLLVYTPVRQFFLVSASMNYKFGFHHQLKYLTISE